MEWIIKMNKFCQENQEAINQAACSEILYCDKNVTITRLWEFPVILNTFNQPD